MYYVQIKSGQFFSDNYSTAMTVVKTFTQMLVTVKNFDRCATQQNLHLAFYYLAYSLRRQARHCAAASETINLANFALKKSGMCFRVRDGNSEICKRTLEQPITKFTPAILVGKRPWQIMLPPGPQTAPPPPSIRGCFFKDETC